MSAGVLRRGPFPSWLEMMIIITRGRGRCCQSAKWGTALAFLLLFVARPRRLVSAAPDSEVPQRLRVAGTGEILIRRPPVSGPKAAGNELAALSRRQGATISSVTAPFVLMIGSAAIEGQAACASDVEPLLPGMISELSLYPLGVLAKAKVQRVILCGDLAMNGDSMVGLASSENGLLLIDAALCRRTRARSIHREVFHMIDGGGAVPSPSALWLVPRPPTPGLRTRGSDRQLRVCRAAERLARP